MTDQGQAHTRISHCRASLIHTTPLYCLTYHADQVAKGTVDESLIDETVKTLLRVKFKLGLFENPFPYEDYRSSIRTEEGLKILHQADTESIVLLQNKNNILPLSKDIGSVALIGPHADRVTFGVCRFFSFRLHTLTFSVDRTTLFLVQT